MSPLSRTPRTVLGAPPLPERRGRYPQVPGVLDPGAATRILSVVRSREAGSLTTWPYGTARGDGEAPNHHSGGAGAPHAGAVPGVPDRTITVARTAQDSASSEADHHTIELNRPRASPLRAVNTPLHEQLAGERPVHGVRGVDMEVEVHGVRVVGAVSEPGRNGDPPLGDSTSLSSRSTTVRFILRRSSPLVTGTDTDPERNRTSGEAGGRRALRGSTELFSVRGFGLVKYRHEVARKGVGPAGPAVAGAPV